MSLEEALEFLNDDAYCESDTAMDRQAAQKWLNKSERERYEKQKNEYPS